MYILAWVGSACQGFGVGLVKITVMGYHSIARTESFLNRSHTLFFCIFDATSSVEISVRGFNRLFCI